MDSEELELLTKEILKEEAKMEQAFKETRESLPDEEKEINGFEYYGLGHNIYTLGNIAMNHKIISRNCLDRLHGIYTGR